MFGVCKYVSHYLFCSQHVDFPAFRGINPWVPYVQLESCNQGKTVRLFLGYL